MDRPAEEEMPGLEFDRQVGAEWREESPRVDPCVITTDRAAKRPSVVSSTQAGAAGTTASTVARRTSSCRAIAAIAARGSPCSRAPRSTSLRRGRSSRGRARASPPRPATRAATALRRRSGRERPPPAAPAPARCARERDTRRRRTRLAGEPAVPLGHAGTLDDDHVRRAPGARGRSRARRCRRRRPGRRTRGESRPSR